MKTIQFSQDVAEWTRYYYEIDVPDDMTPEEIKEFVYEGNSSEWRDRGTRVLDTVDGVDTRYHWPEEF